MQRRTTVPWQKFHAGGGIAIRPPALLSPSGADRVGHAFLGEARLGGTSKFLARCRRIACLLRVALTFLHEAVERRAGELLFGGLRLAGRILRKGATADAR